MSLTAAALLSPCPTKDDLHVISAGIVATAPLDVAASFGINAASAGRMRSRITIRASDEVFFVFGADSSMGAPSIAAGVPGTAGIARRIGAGGEASMTLRGGRTWVSIVATNAATRVEIQVERG